MALKAFCDVCGKQAEFGSPISEGSSSFSGQRGQSRYKGLFRGKKFLFQVQGMIWTSKDSVCWDLFHACKKCLAGIILAMKPERE